MIGHASTTVNAEKVNDRPTQLETMHFTFKIWYPKQWWHCVTFSIQKTGKQQQKAKLELIDATDKNFKN